MHEIPRILSALLVCAATLAAQQWQLPSRGVAVYEREASFTPPNIQPPGFRYAFVPPLLFQGELDARQRFMRWTPDLLRDLPLWVASDLRHWGKKKRIRLTIPRLMPFGSVELRGHSEAVDEQGWQALELELRSGEPVQGDIPASLYKGYFLPTAHRQVAGRLTLRRHFDPDRGVIDQFEARLEARISNTRQAKDRHETVYRETWKLLRLRQNRDAGFRGEVAAAIRKGAARVLGEIKDLNRAPLKAPGHGDLSMGSGRLALCLLTLIKAGIAKDHPQVAAGFAELRRRVIRGTYPLATCLMAFEALYAPADERQLLLEGRIDKPRERKPKAADLQLMRSWTSELLKCFDIRVRNPAYLLRFDYRPAQRRFDNSNSQYAALGLYSAMLCGIEVSPTAWHGILNHWLTGQCIFEKGRESFRLTSIQAYEAMRVAAARGRKPGTRGGGLRLAPGGWPYVGPNNKNEPFRSALTGSMTTAGITGLAIASAAMVHLDTGARQIRKAQRAMQHGFAWLHRNFTLRFNKHQNGWYFYYLYGLERACELARVGLIGERDWYFEGASLLIAMQQPNGNFHSSLEDCCFAVLFLKQAAPPLPSLTGK